VTKELDVNSKEGKAELKKQQEEASLTTTDSVTKPIPSLGTSRYV